MIARPIVVGHQGSTEEGVVPGSLDAYRLALEAGAEMVEADARRTVSGDSLVIHDAELHGSLVRELSTQAVRDALGPSLATLREVAELVAERGRLLMVDLKEIGDELDALAPALETLGPQGLVVSTLEDVSVRTVRAELPDVAVGLSLGRDKPPARLRTRVSEVFPWRRAEAAGASFLSVNWQFMATRFASRAARRRMPIYVWTVDEDERLRRFLAQTRIRGVITNRPRRALQLRGELADGFGPPSQESQ